MFEHVLIVEDHESTSISVRKTLEELQVRRNQYVYYCDDALLQLRNAVSAGDPFDLLVTDLFFEPDDRPQVLSGGAALIAAARTLQPSLKVLVFSAESSPVAIDSLFKQIRIDGFVRKARRDAEQLKVAISRLAEGRQHYPPELSSLGRHKQSHDFQAIDIEIIKLLSRGVLQKNIPAHLSQPHSLSTVEKRLATIRQNLGYTKNEQIIAFCKDARMI